MPIIGDLSRARSVHRRDLPGTTVTVTVRRGDLVVQEHPGLRFPLPGVTRPRGKSETRERRQRQCRRRRCGNRWPQCSRGEPARRFPRCRRDTFTLSLSLSHSALRLSVRRAGRRLFPLSTEQQPAIRRATPFCSLALSRHHERATGAVAS